MKACEELLESLRPDESFGWKQSYVYKGPKQFVEAAREHSGEVRWRGLLFVQFSRYILVRLLAKEIVRR